MDYLRCIQAYTRMELGRPGGMLQVEAKSKCVPTDGTTGKQNRNERSFFWIQKSWWRPGEPSTIISWPRHRKKFRRTFDLRITLNQILNTWLQCLFNNFSVAGSSITWLQCHNYFVLYVFFRFINSWRPCLNYYLSLINFVLSSIFFVSITVPLMNSYLFRQGYQWNLILCVKNELVNSCTKIYYLKMCG